MENEYVFVQCQFCGHFGKIAIDESGREIAEATAQRRMSLHENHCTSNPLLKSAEIISLNGLI